MSTTSQIFDKVAALQSKETQAKQGPRKGNGTWAEVDTFTDPKSGISVVVTERIRGRPAFSIQVVHFNAAGDRRNLCIPIPCEGAEHPVEDIVRALTKRACELVEEKRAETAKRSERPRRDRKDKGPHKDRPVTGLSELTRRDAEKKGKADEFVGKTAKKKASKVKAMGSE